MPDEDIIRLNLDQERQAYEAKLEEEQEAREPESTGPKKMGTGVFLFALILTFIQFAVEIPDAGLLGWVVAAPISILLWFLLRPYNKSLKSGRWILGSLLAWDAIPFISLIPVDIFAIIYVYVKSRSAVAEHLENLANKVKNRGSDQS
jgi:hypothetical protein